MCEAVTAAVVKQLSGIQRQLKNVSYVGSFKQLCESCVKITKTIYNQKHLYCAVKLFHAHWYVQTSFSLMWKNPYLKLQMLAWQYKGFHQSREKEENQCSHHQLPLFARQHDRYLALKPKLSCSTASAFINLDSLRL